MWALPTVLCYLIGCALLPACQAVFCVPQAAIEYDSSPGAPGSRYSVAFNPSFRIFKFHNWVTDLTLNDFRCNCLSQCLANSTCVNVFILTHSQYYVCYGLSYGGWHTVATSLSSESWVISGHATVPPATVACSAQASLAYSSTTAGGERFDNIYDPAKYAFSSFGVNHLTASNADFRCSCLQTCASTASCVSAAILNSGGRYICYGFTDIGNSTSSTQITESWLVPK